MSENPMPPEKASTSPMRGMRAAPPMKSKSVMMNRKEDARRADRCSLMSVMANDGAVNRSHSLCPMGLHDEVFIKGSFPDMRHSESFPVDEPPFGFSSAGGE
jgi:hypothetical protein